MSSSVVNSYRNAKDRQRLEAMNKNSLDLAIKLERQKERAVKQYYHDQKFGVTPLPRPIRVAKDLASEREDAVNKLASFMLRSDAVDTVFNIDVELFNDSWELFKESVKGRKKVSPQELMVLWKAFIRRFNDPNM
jgi:hypothetical protein